MDWKLLPKRNSNINLNPTIDSIWLLYINDWQNCPFHSPQFDIEIEGGSENSDVRTLKCATF